MSTNSPEFKGQLMICGLPVNADSIARLQACLSACEGLTTDEVAGIPVPLDRLARDHRTMRTERDCLLAALELLSPWIMHNTPMHVSDMARAAIDQVKTPTFKPTARYTSVSKGGTYERMGTVRGAGSLKGLVGTAYRNDKGDLFIREPECFAKRMVLIKEGQ